MASDAELAARIRDGDIAAFRALYQRYEGRVFRFLLRLAKDRAVAEDLFQETWLSFAKNARRLEDVSDMAPLLFTIARNKYRNWRRWALLDWSRIELLQRTTAQTTADGVADAREELAAIERALSELPLAAREILLLVGVEGLEPSQAAEVLAIEPDAARQRLARARAQLTARLTASGLPRPPSPCAAGVRPNLVGRTIGENHE
jgi:RNA polymerase sigma-70 factor (ECF subfamily)